MVAGSNPAERAMERPYMWAVSQLAEHGTLNPGVTGSIPVRPTIIFKFTDYLAHYKNKKTLLAEVNAMYGNVFVCVPLKVKVKSALTFKLGHSNIR